MDSKIIHPSALIPRRQPHAYRQHHYLSAAIAIQWLKQAKQTDV